MLTIGNSSKRPRPLDQQQPKRIIKMWVETDKETINLDHVFSIMHDRKEVRFSGAALPSLFAYRDSFVWKFNSELAAKTAYTEL
jgi:hypothetical protein